MRTYKKDPDETLDYSFLWSDWLVSGDFIVDSSWFLDDSSDDAVLEISSTQLPSYSGTTTTVWLEGGTIGARYRVTNRVETDGGRIADRSFIVKVVSR